MTALAAPSLRIFFGLAIGQGTVLLATPLLTRLYTPEQVGVSGAFLALASIAGTLATFRFETLIPGVHQQLVPWLIRRALTTAAVVTAIATLTYFLFFGYDPANASLFGATVAGLAGTALLMQIAARDQFLDGIPTAKAAQGVGQTSLQATLGFPAGSSIGLQAGIAGGYLLSAGIQMLFLRGAARPATPRDSVRPRKRRLWRSALTLSVAAMINICTVWMYPLLMQHFFGSYATGQLTIAQRVGLAPAAMIVASLSPVIIGQLSALLRSEQGINHWMSRWMLRLLPLGALTFILMIFLPQGWISALLGPEWGLSGQFLAALGVMVASQLVIGPFGMVLVIQGRSEAQLVWDLSRLVVLLAATSAVALITADPVAMIWTASFVTAGFYGCYAFLIFKMRAPHPK